MLSVVRLGHNKGNTKSDIVVPSKSTTDNVGTPT